MATCRDRLSRRIKKIQVGRKVFKKYYGYDPITKSGLKTHWFSKDHPLSGLLEHKFLNLYGKTRKPCSCYMCGNARKFFKQRTLQELSSEEMMKLELEEMYRDAA